MGYLFVRAYERSCLGPVDGGGDDIDLILILMYTYLSYFICLMF